MANMLLDGSHKALVSLDSFVVTKSIPTAFAGATTNARGDSGGTQATFTLFAVTGDVEVGIYGVCTTDLASTGAGTLALGITGNTAIVNAATTATTIDVNEVWMSTIPAIGMPLDSLNFYVIGNGVDIVETTGTADIESGNIYYVALWRPLSAGSTIVSSYPPTS